MGEGSDLVTTLFRRHGTAVHQHKSLIVLAICLLFVILYSLAALAWGAYHPRAKRFSYPTIPRWILVLLFIAPFIYGFASHWNSAQLQFARRSGRLALAAATFTVFLSAKPAYLPRTYTAPLTSIHKWMGRLAALLAFVHATVYSWNYLVRGSEMHHPFFSFPILIGALATVIFATIVLTSLPLVRRNAYQVFYAIHVPSVWAIYVIMIFHARPAAPFLIAMAIGMLTIQFLLRLLSTKQTSATSVVPFGPNLYMVVLPRDALASGVDEFMPGSYLRIGYPIYHPRYWISSTHPYTIASSPDDQEVRLVIRKTRFTISPSSPISVRGPFAAPFDPMAYSKVVCLVGGSGISIVPPIYRCHDRVLVIWSVKSKAEAAILHPIGIDTANVYVTGPDEASQEIELEDLEEDRLMAGNDEDTIYSDRARTESADKLAGFRYFRGRPLLTPATEDFVDPEKDGKDLCVVACGPPGMIEGAQRWATRHGHSFYVESFAL